MNGVLCRCWLRFGNIFDAPGSRLTTAIQWPAAIGTTFGPMILVMVDASWLLGYGSCGCSGNIEIPATLFIAIDWAIVAWFVTGGFGFVRHPWEAIVSMKIEFSRCWHAQSAVSRQRWLGGGLFAAALGLMQLPVAQPVWTAIMGKPAIVAAVAFEGDLRLNQTQAGSVTINNRSNQAAKVIGMDRSCRCFELADGYLKKGADPLEAHQFFKVNTLAGEGQTPFSDSLPLVIKPNKTGLIQQRIVLFLEHSESFRVPINLAVFAKGDE